MGVFSCVCVGSRVHTLKRCVQLHQHTTMNYVQAHIGRQKQRESVGMTAEGWARRSVCEKGREDRYGIWIMRKGETFDARNHMDQCCPVCCCITGSASRIRRSAPSSAWQLSTIIPGDDGMVSPTAVRGYVTLVIVCSPSCSPLFGSSKTASCSWFLSSRTN